jgi:2-hydroxycyclohexanecarboxyl-CoA dehydrogenase
MNRRTALVTGAGAGIGAAIACRFARDGMAVGVLDIDGAGASAVVHEITNAGGSAIAVQADIADRQQIVAAVSGVRRAFGPITVLVNNAGIEANSPFEDITDELWDRVMAINLRGTFITTQVVLPDMKGAKWGRIVNISSAAAQSGAPLYSHYAASKGGMIALTKSLAGELGPSGITVNTIPPRFIITPMTQRMRRAGLYKPFEEMAALNPVRRAGKPEDVAGACAYLVSDEAGYVTGQIISVNGGGYI